MERDSPCSTGRGKKTKADTAENNFFCELPAGASQWQGGLDYKYFPSSPKSFHLCPTWQHAKQP